jgi:ribonuclease T
MMMKKVKYIRERFRGFLPIVVDVETGGVDSRHDALLEIAMVSLKMDEMGQFSIDALFHEHVMPHIDTHLNPKSLAFNKIDPYHPFRFAKTEKEALETLFHEVKKLKKQHNCTHAVLVGHNAWFDLGFINEAAARNKLKSPFHAFTSFDTATLSALVYGQTVLPKALMAAGIGYNADEAHSAIYDAMRTAELFCKIVND